MARASRPWVFVGLGALGACGAPKEAADPADVLRGEGLFELPAEEPELGAVTPSEPAVAPALASRADCAAAARHVQRLSLEPAPSGAAHLASPGAAREREQMTRECLDKQTTRREAQCIARLRDVGGIDGCAAE